MTHAKAHAVLREDSYKFAMIDAAIGRIRAATYPRGSRGWFAYSNRVLEHGIPPRSLSQWRAAYVVAKKVLEPWEVRNSRV